MQPKSETESQVAIESPFSEFLMKPQSFSFSFFESHLMQVVWLLTETIIQEK